MIDRGKRSKKLIEVKSVENINENPESVLVINPVRKEVSPLFKLKDHAILSNKIISD